MAFTSLAYLVDIDWLKEAYRRTRKDGAVGVDGMTAAEYEQDLEGNLQRLLDRAKSGKYRAPPVRRVHIPKGGSSTETRPIGITTLEDKILQRAVVMLLEAGCTDAEVSAITGQSRDMVAHYSIMVNQRKLARAAILKWEGANGP